MSGPEQKNHISEAQQNAEALKKLAEALGQKPDTQEAFGNQVGQTGAAERAMKHAQEQHGTPGMSTRGPQFNRESYERDHQPKPTSSADAMKNSNNAREQAGIAVPSILNAIKTNPHTAHLQKPALMNALATLGSQPIQIDGKMAHNLGIQIPGLSINVPDKSVSMSAMQLKKMLQA